MTFNPTGKLWLCNTPPEPQTVPQPEGSKRLGYYYEVKNMVITKEEFEKYKKVQYSGVTNMFDVKRVCELSGLTREKCMEIMKEYGNLETKFK